MAITYVESDRVSGPRGDIYSWCRIRKNGTLEFGHEDGNYAGGVTFSEDYFNWMDQDKVMHTLNRKASMINNKLYWSYLSAHLDNLRDTDMKFLLKIHNMIVSNGLKLSDYYEHDCSFTLSFTCEMIAYRLRNLKQYIIDLCTAKKRIRVMLRNQGYSEDEIKDAMKHMEINIKMKKEN